MRPPFRWPVGFCEERVVLVGNPLVAVGNPLEAVRNPLEAVGNPLQAVGNPPEAVGNPLEAVGNPLEAVGNPLEAVGKQPLNVGGWAFWALKKTPRWVVGPRRQEATQTHFPRL